MVSSASPRLQRCGRCPFAQCTHPPPPVCGCGGYTAQAGALFKTHIHATYCLGFKKKYIYNVVGRSMSNMEMRHGPQQQNIIRKCAKDGH